MAINSAYLSPAEPAITGSVTAAASSGEVVIGSLRPFAIVADAAINVKFGVSGMTAADATAYRIPANTEKIYFLGKPYDRIRIFNPAGTTNYWIQFLFAQG